MVKQYLLFEVATRPYCVSLSAVREVRRLGAITEVPQSPEHVLGVINLRGDILPVIDLQHLLTGQARAADLSATTCLIGESAERLAAFCVDVVSDVVEIAEDAVLPLPSAVKSTNGDLFIGIVLVNKVHFTELNLPKLVLSIQQTEELME
jgi:purine-binding chemotaxis protein CheW